MARLPTAALRACVIGVTFLFGINLPATPVLAQPGGQAPAACKMIQQDAQNAIAGLSAAPQQAVAVPATTFLPAGGPAKVAVERRHTEGEIWYVVGQLVTGTSNITRLSREQSVNASTISDKHWLVTNGRVTSTATLVTFNVPAELWSLWFTANFYLFRCESANAAPIFVSSFESRTTNGWICAGIAAVFVLLMYLASAIVAFVIHRAQFNRAEAGDERAQQYTWENYYDPIVITAGANGKGSPSKLQIFVFSLIVGGLLVYIFASEGRLSDISESIAYLLGISGVAAAGSKLTDVTKNRLDYGNYAYFVNKGWLVRGGLATANLPKWGDILGADGELDVYHVQMLFVSAIVAAALLTNGFIELASFTIPPTLLGILGLSQAVYVGGKAVNPASFAELNKAAAELKKAEDAFRDAVVTAQPAGGVPNVNAARALAPHEYTAYMNQVKDVKQMFEDLLGQGVPNAAVRPRFAY